MKVIICGAGEVGKALAQHLLKENNDITIIDQSEENLKEIKEQLDVNTYLGFGSQPGILDKAGAKNAEMVWYSITSPNDGPTINTAKLVKRSRSIFSPGW